jgi:hypothetical protein
VNAARRTVTKCIARGIARAMNIADARRHGIHGTGDEALPSARFDDFATGRDTVTLRNFRSTQAANQGPHRVVMHRRRRISSP